MLYACYALLAGIYLKIHKDSSSLIICVLRRLAKGIGLSTNPRLSAFRYNSAL